MFSGTAHLGIFFALLGAALASALAVPSASACGVASGAATVAAVTERGEIRLDDGRVFRLAGLDSPGAAAGGVDAGALARELLTKDWVGKNVAVAVLASRPDRWGRWLGDLAARDGGSAAIDLLRAGLARVRPEFETRGCEAERLEAEAGARAAGQGLWNDPDSVWDAGDLDVLRANDGRFALIEGVVRGVGVGRSRVYLDFGKRGGFTVVVAKKSAPGFQRRGVALNELTGRAVRVRGVLENRYGPRVEIVDPLMIERLDGPKETKPGG